jgi:hypothetical protein
MADNSRQASTYTTANAPRTNKQVSTRLPAINYVPL